MTLMMERLGSTVCRPRFFTPRDETYPTMGPAVGEVARRLGRTLMGWQQDLADVAYEYDPDSGLFRYNEVDVTVPRQSGKTTLTLAKKVHRLTALARLYGPQRSTYTAQTRLAARKKLERDFSELLRGSRAFREVANAKARPAKATEWRLSLNNGSEAIQFGSGSFLQIDAPSRTGGHGDTLDDGTIDEAFSQEDDTVEAGMRPAMATRKNAQLWVISTAGDARSKYLWRKVIAGRAATESGDHGKVCYVEYSAADDDDPADPATWWGCMPALGVTITEEFIRGEWERAQRKGPEGIDTFRRAYLNQWPNVPILAEAGGGAIPSEIWNTLITPAPPWGSNITFALDVAPDHSSATVAAAWVTGEGQSWVQLADTRPGVEWVPDRCADLLGRYGGRLLVEQTGTAAFLLPHLTAETVSRRFFADACSTLDAAVQARSMRHGNQPELNAAVGVARWSTSGEAGQRVLSRKNTSVSPLVAVALALHGIQTAPPTGGWMIGL